MNKNIAKNSLIITVASIVPTYLILLMGHTLSPILVLPFSIFLPIFGSMWLYEQCLKLLEVSLQQDLSNFKNIGTLMALFFTTHFIYYYFVLKIFLKKKYVNK